MKEIKLPIILGPTASGKTKVAAHVAYSIDGEIISADSRQVYKRMTIGTGKDYDDYQVNGKQIPYHIIDIQEPGYKYNVFEYQSDFRKKFIDIIERGKQPIVCGGTGLYLESIIKNYNLHKVPENKEFRVEYENKSNEELAQELRNYKKLHNSSDLDSKKRLIRALEIAKYENENSEFIRKTELVYTPLIFGIDVNRETRRSRIENRFYKRLHEGMIQEVEGLLNSDVSADDMVYYGLEYKYVTNYILGKITKKQLEEELLIAIFQFSKRQMTWFRGMERRGIKIQWINGEQDFSLISQEILSILEKMK